MNGAESLVRTLLRREHLLLQPGHLEVRVFPSREQFESAMKPRGPHLIEVEI